MKEKNKFGLGILIGVLITLVICLSSFIVYDKFFKEDKNNENIPSEENKNHENQNNENNVVCRDCVKEIVFEDYVKENVEKKIIFENKVRTLKVVVNQSEVFTSIMLDNQEIRRFPGTTLEYLTGIYILKDDYIMVTTTGSDIRNNKYYFYNSNLKEVSKSMTLDNEYPNSMVETFRDTRKETFSVEDDKITILASRTTHEKELVLEDKQSVALCKYDFASKKNNLIESVYDKYKGQPLVAKYEIEYLGNGEFSSPKRVEIVETINETYCDF